MRNINEFFSITDLLVFNFFVHILNINGGKLDGYSPNPEDVYQGRYTQDIRQGELLIPRLVREDGAFHTYELSKFYERQESDAEPGTRGRRKSQDDRAHLMLEFAGEAHHVELQPHLEFISPWLVIESWPPGSDGGSLARRSPSSRSVARRRHCHYRGLVRRQPSSRAALSLCDGVTGYLQTDHGRYFIEPLHGDEPDADGQHVHVVYKKEAPHEKLAQSSEPFCGTSEDWEGAWDARLQRAGGPIDGRSRATKAAQHSATHSVHRYVEVALVADRRFLDFHAGTNYEQYLLAVMNMVSDFYHDASVGNQIDVVVVRMIYLERQQQEIDLHVSPNAEKTLESFAAWIEKLNPSDPEHPNHFDVGALVTRYDLCAEGNNCNLLGLAYVAAACERKKAACINEDSGLLLGVVIAHEIGHTLGCAHDTEEISGCSSTDKDQSYFVMSPIVFIYTIRWSTCSRKFITSFFESGLGDCLINNPRNPPARYRYPDMLPGAMYGADFQCNLAYPGSKPCDVGDEECQALWCNVDGMNCKSNGSPPADGTKCGENKWCIHKKCVEMGSRGEAVHGGWADWGRPSACSRTCGGGVRFSERECDNPPPRNGGRYCVGERKKFSICNVNPCDGSKPSFRAVQCSEYNKKNVLPAGPHKWEPFLRDDLEACALYCVNQARTFIKLSPTARDGTPCKPGTYHMCISGVCRKVGCDWVLDSDAVEDVCGVCNGGGTECAKVEDTYKEVGQLGYATIVKIPKGSKSINVYEMDEHENTLAVKVGKKNKYCLNGNLKEQASGDYSCAGATIMYKHVKTNLEEIVIKGPLKEDIEVQYVFYKSSNPGVHYEYYVDVADTTYVPKYSWEFVEWSDCDVKCGGGTKISEASCVESRAGKVALEFCRSIRRPSPKSQICNEAPCPAKWRVSQWTRCSGCGGEPGEMRRKIQCVRPGARAGDDYVQASFDACQGSPPVQRRECIGAEPCRRACPTGVLANTTAGQAVPAALQRQLIDDLVDYGLARYLEESRAASAVEESRALEGSEEGDGDELERTLREWAREEEEKKVAVGVEDVGGGPNAHLPFEQTKAKRAPSLFTTPVPGSVIVDSLPRSEIVVYEAPLVQDRTRANMSDADFQKHGDKAADDSLDTRRKKVYRGEEAIEHLKGQREGANDSSTDAGKTNVVACARRRRRCRRLAKRRVGGV